MSVADERLARERHAARVVLTPILAHPERGQPGERTRMEAAGIAWCAVVLVLMTLALSWGQDLLAWLGVGYTRTLQDDSLKFIILAGSMLAIVVGPFYMAYRARERRERQRLEAALKTLPVRPMPMVGSLCQSHPEGGLIFQIIRQGAPGRVDIAGVVDSDGLPFDDVHTDIRVDGLFPLRR